MPERGISQSFPWMQLSTWKDRYCDKEFLYHLAMMPLTQFGSEPILGARMFAVLLSVTVIGVLYWLLRANKVSWPLFFSALPFGMGGLFIARLGMIRSHVLSMLLLLFGIHFLLASTMVGLVRVRVCVRLELHGPLCPAYHRCIIRCGAVA